MIKTYETKTQATKAKRYGQTVRRRRDGKWVCENPKCKCKRNVETCREVIY